jgi:hypothetical protein
MSDVAGEEILQVYERLEVFDPSGGSLYNQNIRGIYNWRDVYDNANTYYNNDVVSYNDSTYIRISQTPGNEVPTDPSWEILPGTTIIKRDLQSITQNNLYNQSSNGWNDFNPNLELTAKDLGSVGTYKVTFTCVGSISSNNRLLSFRLLLNNSLIPDQQAEYLQFQNEKSTGVIVCVVSGINDGDVFKVQWQRQSGTVTFGYRSLAIDGTISSNIVT